MKGDTIMETTNKTTNATFDKICDVWATIVLVCHFVPLVCSLVWILYYTVHPSNFVVNYIMTPLLIIGWGAALIARLGKFLVMPFSFVAKGWSIGWFICPFFPLCLLTAVFGAIFGFAGAMMIAVYAPAAVTIFCLFTDD